MRRCVTDKNRKDMKRNKEEKTTLGQLTDAIRMLAITAREAISVEDAAFYMGYDTAWLRRLMNDGEIPYYRRGRRVWFRRSELDKWQLGEPVADRSEIDRRAEEYLRRAARN